MKKNDRFTIKIEDISEDGAGIGKTEGYIWFIKDTIIGDEVEAAVMKQKKNYGFARLVRVLTPSPYRIQPKCPVSRSCGGCQLQAMDYQEQLRFKERKVYQHLTRIGGVKELSLPGEGGRLEMESIIGMENPWRYRNKAQFPFGRNKEGQIIFGFYAGHTHAIIEQDDCLLGTEENKEILTIIRDYMNEFQIPPYDEITHTGLIRHVLIRKGFYTGEIMVCLVINGKSLPYAECLAERLDELIDGITSVSYSVNTEKTNVILGKKIITIRGQEYITDFIDKIQYKISPLSFYQVNPVQTERLYKTALEYAGLSGNEIVWDLYCGIGTISLFLAQKAKKVYGVEVIPEAIADARKNAELNGIKNIEFFVGKAEEVLPKQNEKRKEYADVIVVDPPRKGCDPICLDTIVKMSPEKVVYISCNSATLARDVKILSENGYQVSRVRTVDQFSWSVHVETCVLLSQ